MRHMHAVFYRLSLHAGEIDCKHHQSGTVGSGFDFAQITNVALRSSIHLALELLPLKLGEQVFNMCVLLSP